MISKATVITHGSNAVRYSMDKDEADIIKVNHLPENITSSAIWSRMILHQERFREKLNRHRPLKNTSIRIELSPAKEESQGWTLDDWRKLADEYIKEFDSIDLSQKAKRDSAQSTHLENSQYVVSLHRDSKGKILHLHINANRVDMDGRVNDAHFIADRAMMAANNIAKRRGWVQASEKRQQNLETMNQNIENILLNMDSFDWDVYIAQLQEKGYNVKIKRDLKNKVVNYVVLKGRSRFKSSELGRSRNLTPSRIEGTWAKMHRNASSDSYKIVEKDGSISTSEHSHEGSTPVYEYSFFAGGRDFSLEVPIEIGDAITDEIDMADDEIFSSLADIENTAILLFFGYIDAATQLSESCGGAGGSAEASDWGDDDDKDDLERARRCARQAMSMHRRRSRGWNR